MKKRGIVILMSCVVVVFFSYKTDRKDLTALERFRPALVREINSTSDDLLKNFKGSNRTALQEAYNNARNKYKHVEFFIEYCSALEAKYFINGPLVPKFDADMGNEVYDPNGFQKMEELLFSDQDQPVDTIELQKQTLALSSQLLSLSDYYKTIELGDEQLLEMFQMQLFRISAMNLSGYDATISQTNVEECSWSVDGMIGCLGSFKEYADENETIERAYTDLLKEIFKAKKYLLKHKDYNTFDRLHFITTYVTPLNKKIIAFHNACGLPWTEKKQSLKKQALNLQQPFLFGKESLNPQYFSIYYDDTINIEPQAALGKLLFFDPLLSGNNKRSCASCHNPSKAFTDGLQKSLAFDNESKLPRNAPTLLNVIYQRAYFEDGRAYQLEQQVFDVVHNENEMQGKLEDVIKKLHSSRSYEQLFKAAFKGTPDTVITEYAIQKSIAEYEKKLVSFNSRFDKYLKGDHRSLTKREINGYNLFAGKALCGSCHFLPLFNGTVPPGYSDSEYEIIGTPEDSTNKKLDADQGRYKISHVAEQLHAFKTPTVRNCEYTAPYMHNGAFNKLEDVVEFYHKGGGAGLKLDVPNQTLPFDSLQLEPREKEDIVLFLKALSDTTGLTQKPLMLPSLDADAKINKRIVSGSY